MHYGYDVGCCYDPCGYGFDHGYGYGYGAPAYGYGAPSYGYGGGRGFALIVVLFILLVIVGAARFAG
ncbi:YjcZ family sporulation protein [Texcoconibacillus texcoconensis]|uniref:Uncharacterized protein (TIGR01732 family) n=1 Tax=Texcoconibacillus texcoconensis TaxID=1095777 RepID=A0A840QLK8_9BACI|nr:YjcZ family sporulation protein [Texcoconibacillus texcoconensis]MBB5172243.1 uncharacterized protein (TIGR01732 family) [Texcoconibacillus texcoconensis]